MPQRLNILILGGTLFLGRHLVETALERGHEVTLFNRGVTNPALFPDIEKLSGDRDGDLDVLRGRCWDAAVDTSGYVPRIVGASVRLLASAVDQYVFVSSCSVYADTSKPGVDESASVIPLKDENDESIERNYGALKGRCEEVAQEAFPGRSFVVRAGLIVGPHDPTNRFTYWVTRLSRGGRVLAPEPRTQPVQLVDVRDLSAWMVRMIEAGASGIYNVTGPHPPLSMGEALDQINAAVGGGAELVWADERFLLDHGLSPWTELPLWLAPQTNPEDRGFLALDVSRALAAGLTFRPLGVTARDTLDWALGAEPGEPASRLASGVSDVALIPARETELLDAWDHLRGSDTDGSVR